MSTRIDNINERRARRQAQAPSPLPNATQASTPTEPAASVTPSAGMMPAQPVAAAQVAGRANPANAPVPTINPESTTQESMRRVALQNMDEEQFRSAQEDMNASDKEYWSEQARLNPLNTYANLRNYFASEETPDERRKRERREHLGQVFANLGNLIGNAAQLYYTAKGAVPADLNAGAFAENERMRRIKEKRDALKARQDAILAEAKGDDIRNAYNVRLAREKAAADAADKQKGRDLDLMKFGMKLKADKDKADADRKLKEQQAKETGRHNRAMEARAAQQDLKVLDSGIASDGNVYTRNSKLSENETIQFVKKYMSDDDLKQYISTKIEPVYNPETDQFENSGKMYVDWDAALGKVLQSGMVPPEELSSRGFRKSGRAGERPLLLKELGYDTRNIGGLALDAERNRIGSVKTVEGFGSSNNGKKKIEGF